MKSFLSILLFLLFFGLSLIHFYWASGGLHGYSNALPANEQGIPVLSPTTFDSIFMGTILLWFGLFYLFLLRSVVHKTLILIRTIGLWMIPIIFFLRAVGDFNYVGFFKEIKSTEFAYLDTAFYSPLCLAISLIGFTLIGLKNKAD